MCDALLQETTRNQGTEYMAIFEESGASKRAREFQRSKNDQPKSHPENEATRASSSQAQSTRFNILFRIRPFAQRGGVGASLHNGGRRCRAHRQRFLFLDLAGANHDVNADGRDALDHNEKESGARSKDGWVWRHLVHMQSRGVVGVACVGGLEDEHALAHVLKAMGIRKSAQDKAKGTWKYRTIA